MSGIIVNDFIDRLGHTFREGDPNAAAKTIEADNVRLLQSIYQTIIDGNFAAFADMLAEDVDLEILGPLAIPFLGSWRGRQQVAEAVRNNFNAVEEQHPELQSVIAQGDTVVASGRERGRCKATGQTYDVQWVQFHTFDGGKLVRTRQLASNTPS